ncbi:MAG: class I SAM-dependent methyltransferase, partial [Atribacterota bacterium]
MGNEQQHRIFWNAGVRREKRRDLHPEKRIHTDEVWMDLEPLFSPGLRVLDAGGGCGRYSILIAKKGCQVTHLDLSSGMLQEARKQAEREGVRGITFGEGKVQDLSAFSDQSFDVVLSLDAPVSYASPFHKKALQELCRVCQDKLAVSVVSRLGQLPVILRMEIQWRKSVEFS